ncbi:MAG: hypothetical protein ACR2NN_26200 [Bryobacteraceae bacterium]
MTRREAILRVVGRAILPPASPSSRLPDDLTARLLEREFPRPDLSYLLMDVRSRHAIASRALNPDEPIPFGSLVKPFVAYAHRGPLPTVICHGCWKPGGHGRLTLPLALAHSCNVYFLELARNINPFKLAEVGLSAPDVATPEAWIGLGRNWRISPRRLVNGYCELLIRSPREILEGMRLSAKFGTARAIRCDAYATTGTAPCHHAKRTPGDGYAMALYPASNPRWALLASLDGALARMPRKSAAKCCDGSARFAAFRFYRFEIGAPRGI